MSHFTVYVKFSWFFLFSGYLVLCVCKMMKLLLVNDTLSYLNLRNDKRNSSPLGRRSHKTSMVFNGGSFLRMCGKFMIILFTYQLAGIL